VYGGGWTPELLDPHRLQGEWIPNHELRRYYSSAGIVLCDHYDDMRDEGFISNRAYDALACGAFVISDRVPAIEEEFDGGLVTYGDADELGRLVDRYLDDPDERRQLATRGRAAVLARHTFAHRVDTIIAEVTRLQSDGRETSV
jgi:spore maturation protein CgeB